MTLHPWFSAVRRVLKANIAASATGSGASGCSWCRTSSASRMLMRWSVKNMRKWTGHPSLRRALTVVNEELDTISQLFAKQCNAIMVQRLRRSLQICSLYSRIYNECAVRYFASRFAQRIMQSSKGHRFPLMLGATIFSWAQERVTDEELQE